MGGVYGEGAAARTRAGTGGAGEELCGGVCMSSLFLDGSATLAWQSQQWCAPAREVGGRARSALLHPHAEGLLRVRTRKALCRGVAPLPLANAVISS